jgi:hypothetical protein
MIKHGSCVCGAVTFRYEGQTRAVSDCDCQLCATAFSLNPDDYLLVNPDNFEWLSGEDQITTYTAANGSAIQSCCKCGTAVAGCIDGEIHGISKQSIVPDDAGRQDAADG